MNDIAVDYILEKTMVAVNCLCEGNGTFEERFYNAYISALIRLRLGNPPKEFADDLKWILELCDLHLVADKGRMNTILETDQRKLVNKLIHLFIETSRITA